MPYSRSSEIERSQRTHALAQRTFIDIVLNNHLIFVRMCDNIPMRDESYEHLAHTTKQDPVVNIVSILQST